MVNAASGAAGVAPGAWISIYGSNLAAATRTMSASDLVDNTMPQSLGGVSVQIDGKAAYPYYVSPSQINVLSPSDSAAGSVPVSVTTSAGTSAAVTAVMQAILPGWFTQSSYVRAVRASDGTIIDGTSTAARPGDLLELYGTGFGPTETAVAAGLVFSGAYPVSNAVTVTIGGMDAVVSFAGLVGPGLYQVNAVVPAGLPDGDYAVIATCGGVSTQSTAMLKIKNA